ncbi:class I mannose-6-phosphate isomerase [Isoptericola sp. F-RaC21]|uniref:class I mannose-6-phosphate isomerase n=1 Tax=Isoptericola sp. F-RaC21 TaxID=3141452 RepID=UPI00315BEFAE
MTRVAVDLARPVVLGPNQPPERFYRGGDRIAAFRGRQAGAERVPEDWVGSTTALFGDTGLGLSTLPDGRLLAEAVEADAVHWLGAGHVGRFGADIGLLVKLLDAGERLPVHAHPDVAFAHDALGLGHGKTEAWIVLEPGDVHLGFARDVGRAELGDWVERQDVPAMLGAMHRLTLSRGDAVLVPAGIPHAIGDGLLVVELQEPTDLSILLEWDGYGIDGRRDGHLGLGHPAALDAVDTHGWSAAEVRGLVRATAGTDGPLLPGGEPFFRAERWRAPGAWDAGFAVVVVIDGTGELVDRDGRTTDLRRGSTVLVPHAAGELDLVAGPRLEVVRCRPPAPSQTG